MALDSKIPPGPIEKKWEYAKAHYKLVNPANKRKYDVIVVGAGLAGAAAAPARPAPTTMTSYFRLLAGLTSL